MTSDTRRTQMHRKQFAEGLREALADVLANIELADAEALIAKAEAKAGVEITARAKTAYRPALRKALDGAAYLAEIQGALTPSADCIDAEAVAEVAGAFADACAVDSGKAKHKRKALQSVRKCIRQRVDDIDEAAQLAAEDAKRAA